MVHLGVVDDSVDFHFSNEAEFGLGQRFDVDNVIFHQVKHHQVWSVNPLKGLKAPQPDIFQIKYFQARERNGTDTLKQEL